MTLFQRIAQAFDGERRSTFEEFFEEYLLHPSAAARDRIFDAYFRSSAKVLLHARAAREQFLVESSDNVMAREIFVQGSSQFDRVAHAFDILKAELGIDPVERTLIDIGANIGVICVPVVARGLCKSAIAIEPTPSVCRVLRANIALNGLENAVSVYETALSDSGGFAEFELSRENSGDNRVSVKSSENVFDEDKRAKISVKMSRFDQLFEKLDLSTSVVWMDVQGFEGKVLAGATNITSAKPPLVSEFWPYGMRRAQTYELMREALSAYDRFRVLDGQSNWQQMSELDALRDSLSGIDHVDIICVAE
jgi:FkbM family methyltransferase